MPPQPDRGPWSTWSNILALDPPPPLRNLSASAHHRLRLPIQPRLARRGEHRDSFTRQARLLFLKKALEGVQPMNKQFAGLRIFRDDIKALYDSIEEPWMKLTDGCFDWFNDLRVCRHGIFLCDPEEGGRDAIGLSDEEREAPPRHPTDDYEAPLLKLPCTLGEFESFIDTYEIPAPNGFRLLVLIAKRPAPDARAVSRKLSRQVATDFELAVPLRSGFPGLRDTDPTGCQLRMAPDHRHGWRALASS